MDALTDEVTRCGYHNELTVTDKALVQCGVVDKVTTRMDASRAGVGDLCEHDH